MSQSNFYLLFFVFYYSFVVWRPEFGQCGLHPQPCPDVSDGEGLVLMSTTAKEAPQTSSPCEQANQSRIRYLQPLLPVTPWFAEAPPTPEANAVGVAKLTGRASPQIPPPCQQANQCRIRYLKPLLSITPWFVLSRE